MARRKCDRKELRAAFSMENQAAVYAFWNLAGRCLYVGSTKHLKTRLLQHMRGSHNPGLRRWITVDGITDTYFCYRVVEDASALFKTENRYIKLLNPKTNI